MVILSWKNSVAFVWLYSSWISTCFHTPSDFFEFYFRIPRCSLNCTMVIQRVNKIITVDIYSMKKLDVKYYLVFIDCFNFNRFCVCHSRNFILQNVQLVAVRAYHANM